MSQERDFRSVLTEGIYNSFPLDGRVNLISWIVVFLVFTLFLPGCTSLPTPDEPIIEEGVLDMRGWDLEARGNLSLEGTWAFYWMKLLNHQELQNQNPNLLAHVPSTWNQYRIQGEKLPGEGYATYKLHVKTDLQPGTNLGIRINTISSAYRLYINERLVSSSGTVAVTKDDEAGEYRPQVAIFSIPADEFDIIFHVSNFQYARGGLWYNTTIGSAQNIVNLHAMLLSKESILLGALAITGLFFLAIYMFRRELTYTLYFALLCFATVVLVDMLGQLLIPTFIPINFNHVILLWYSSLLWCLFFFIAYLHVLFPSVFSKVVQRIYLIYAIPLQILYMVTEPSFYSRFAYAANAIEIIVLLCITTITIIGLKRKIMGSLLNLLCMAILLIVYIYDVLYLTNYMPSSIGELFYFGLFLVLLIQMVIQAQRIRHFSLETVSAELSFLQAQIKPHFLYNTINTIISISRSDPEKSRDLLRILSHFLRGKFDLQGKNQYVTLKSEIELTKAYVEIQKARFEDRLQVHFHIEEVVETLVPTLILQPVVENAITHGILPKPEGGIVDITIKKVGNSLSFCVKDKGVGMSKEKLHKIWRKTEESGVGLANIEQRMRKLYKKGLKVLSIPGWGTEITWEIPIQDSIKKE